MQIWGDGTPRRELLHVDDLAEAIKYLALGKTIHDLYNVGSGYDLSIREIAETVSKVVGFEGVLSFDVTKPNGTMSKLLDSSRIRELGWVPKVSLTEGLKNAYMDYKSTLANQTARINE